MNIEYSTVFFYIIGIIFLFFFGRIFVGPMKLIMKLVFKCALGGIVILVINLVGGIFGFCIALNPVTSFMIGTLGIPGICLTIVLKSLLNI